MIDSIVEICKFTEYDFRNTANPNDPLNYLFEDWINYYQLKFSISHIIKPTSILEIGVRFGYSAAAFLYGYSDARYVGIDLDTDSYGGVKGAINWAKKITEQFDAEFIIADTQAMNIFPGGIYDLIHVDGQQDGDSSLHDLELATKQGRYVLLDGYLWTKQNFAAVSHFLFRYANILDWYGVIPGYAGELLIKVSPDYLKEFNHNQYSRTSSSLDIRQTYTTDYYTLDCGGFESFKSNQGKKLEDSRLQSVATIASLKKTGSVLDIGCGRGELSYYFVQQGFAVTSIDYSQNAIDLAQKCFEGEEHLKAKVDFICDDVCSVVLSGKYDLAVASDVIEHLSPEEVDKLYQKVADCIESDGLFVVHTFPNIWYYKYDYSRKRRIAASVGAYLPPEPRSRYELLMHINEQSPRILKKQLSKYFQYVCLWFGDPQNPGGSLVTNFSIKEMSAAPSLFAVASHQDINQEHLKNLLQIMSPVPPVPENQIKLAVTNYPQVVEANSQFEIQVEIHNLSKFILNSYGHNPVHIAYHWMNEKRNVDIVFDGERTKLFPPLDTGKGGLWSFLRGNTIVGKQSYKARVKSLPEIGKYTLRVTLVQEGVRWFDQAPTNLKHDIDLIVK